MIISMKKGAEFWLLSSEPHLASLYAHQPVLEPIQGINIANNLLQKDKRRTSDLLFPKQSHYT
jgi:hypothetical protein